MTNLDSDWHPAEIGAELKKRGTSLRALSLRSGMAAGTLYEALRKPYIHGEVIISCELGLKPWIVWPSRYTQERRIARAESAIEQIGGE